MRLAILAALLALAFGAVNGLTPQPARCAGGCSGMCTSDKHCSEGCACAKLSSLPRGRCKPAG